MWFAAAIARCFPSAHSQSISTLTSPSSSASLPFVCGAAVIARSVVYVSVVSVVSCLGESLDRALLLPVIVVAVARWRVLLFLLLLVLLGLFGTSMRHRQNASNSVWILPSSALEHKFQITRIYYTFTITRPAPSESPQLLREYIIIVEIIKNKSKRTKETNRTLYYNCLHSTLYCCASLRSSLVCSLFFVFQFLFNVIILLLCLPLLTLSLSLSLSNRYNRSSCSSSNCCARKCTVRYTHQTK